MSEEQQYLEELLVKEAPPPNTQVFWVANPVTQVRPYGAHIYYGSGLFGEGKAIIVYWKASDHQWYTLGRV